MGPQRETMIDYILVPDSLIRYIKSIKCIDDEVNDNSQLLFLNWIPSNVGIRVKEVMYPDFVL